MRASSALNSDVATFNSFPSCVNACLNLTTPTNTTQLTTLCNSFLQHPNAASRIDPCINAKCANATLSQLQNTGARIGPALDSACSEVYMAETTQLAYAIGSVVAAWPSCLIQCLNARAANSSASNQVESATINAVCQSDNVTAPWTCAYSACNGNDLLSVQAILGNNTLTTQLGSWCLQIAYTYGGMQALNASLTNSTAPQMSGSPTTQLTTVSPTAVSTTKSSVGNTAALGFLGFLGFLHAFVLV
ncbi:hypothetical protein BC830DRAFT_1144566 [Chytriomyces sp. MP71]|nr:hypothetical protein BC830DRAFT_1144566 [Chytriomyces sp. MP71]